MNNDRRKELAAIRDDLDKLQGQLDDARSRLETVKDEEQDYYDNMPESFQNGERGERAQAAIDALDTVINDIEGIDFDAFLSGIDEASE